MVIRQNMKVEPVRSEVKSTPDPRENTLQTRTTKKKRQIRLTLSAISNVFILPMLMYSHNTNFKFIIKKKNIKAKALNIKETLCRFVYYKHLFYLSGWHSAPVMRERNFRPAYCTGGRRKSGRRRREC